MMCKCVIGVRDISQIDMDNLLSICNKNLIQLIVIDQIHIKKFKEYLKMLICNFQLKGPTLDKDLAQVI